MSADVIPFLGAGCRGPDRYPASKEAFMRALLPRLASMSAEDRDRELRAIRAEIFQIVELASLRQ